MLKLLLATTNPGKLREMLALLDDLPVELLTPQQIGLPLEVAEDGITYAENASRKALAFSRAGGILTLADDSGLEVEALNGEPGLYSARYMPKPGATDADRRAFLLQKLKGLPHPWLARFRCTVALADPQGDVQFTEGMCSGEIIPEETRPGWFWLRSDLFTFRIRPHNGGIDHAREKPPQPPGARHPGCSSAAYAADPI